MLSPHFGWSGLQPVPTQCDRPNLIQPTTPRICSLPAALQSCLWDEQLGLWPKLQIGIFLNQPFWEVSTRVLVTPGPWNLISVSFPLWGWSCLLGLCFPGPQLTSCHHTCSEDECWDHFVCFPSLKHHRPSVSAVQGLKMGALCILSWRVLGLLHHGWNWK